MAKLVNPNGFLLKPSNWRDLYFYRKADVLLQMTIAFCNRFMNKYKDRTVDQMVQAARSGKQNIVEGSEDGKTSTEMEIKLLNVARSSIQELQEDYYDYLKANNLPIWGTAHPRYDDLLSFCRVHNDLVEYEPYFTKWTDEEMANAALALTHMVDKMMTTYIAQKEQEFVNSGGIRERMTAARLGQRATQEEQIRLLQAENEMLRQQLQEAHAKIKELSR